jgi:hypothetical protein
MKKLKESDAIVPSPTKTYSSHLSKYLSHLNLSHISSWLSNYTFPSLIQLAHLWVITHTSPSSHFPHLHSSVTTPLLYPIITSLPKSSSILPSAFPAIIASALKHVSISHPTSPATSQPSSLEQSDGNESFVSTPVSKEYESLVGQLFGKTRGVTEEWMAQWLGDMKKLGYFYEREGSLWRWRRGGWLSSLEMRQVDGRWVVKRFEHRHRHVRMNGQGEFAIKRVKERLNDVVAMDGVARWVQMMKGREKVEIYEEIIKRYAPDLMKYDVLLRQKHSSQFFNLINQFNILEDQSVISTFDSNGTVISTNSIWRKKIWDSKLPKV